MTILQVEQEIRADFKAYIGVMKKSTFFSTLARIKDGKAKMSTIRAFFSEFGYVGDFNEWHKWPPQ